MINLSVKDVKMIEKAEEATLRDIMKTQCSAPKHLLYLELGICDQAKKNYLFKTHTGTK